MAKRKLSGGEIEQQAIEIVKTEKAKWEVATAFVTDRVSFKMRELIRIFRKNYYGIFDTPFDPITGLEKTWYPLTEISVEAVVKNIDLDAKDINFRAKHQDAIEFTDLTRNYVKDKLNRQYFGQKLDDFERTLAIDGTAVWKTYKIGDKVVILPVDLLNIYIDPTSPSIQEAYRFTERSLMFPEEIAAMNGWRNTKDLKTTEGLPRTDPIFNKASGFNSNVKMRDVYEMWGRFPKSLITGNVDDIEEVDGHIVVSGIDTPGLEECHLIELNTDKDAEGNALKPYEEAWFTRVPNRWYGRGIAEKLLQLQIYANIVLNVRINKARVSQMGLFKIKKGSGITPQNLSRLPTNGAVVLNNMEDLEQLVVQDVAQSSYNDEGVINQMAEPRTNAFEIVTGERLPSSTPATNAAIQNANAQSGFSIIKEGIGMFLQRWMDRHYLPLIASELTKGQIIRIAKGSDEFPALVETVALNLAVKAIDNHKAAGYIPSDIELELALEDARMKLANSDLFVKMTKDIIANQLETQVYVTNEEMDTAVTIQNLVSMLSAAPQYAEQIVKQAFDLMGLPQFKAPQPMALPKPQIGSQSPAPALQGQQLQMGQQQALTR